MNQVDLLIGKFKRKETKIAVLGLGYVGLPLAVAFAKSGFTVVGIDPIKEKVDSINKGISYIQDIQSEEINKLTKQGKLIATSDFSVLENIDAVSICVPTPLRKTGDPDLSFILAVSETIKKYLHKGMAIVLESTTYPGTTRELFLSKISEENDLIVGEDFFLAFSPERVDPGRKDWTTLNTPKIIGGITPQCLRVSIAWYEQTLEKIIPVSSAEIAEMAKLLENTFRMINIGLVNEMAMMCDRLGVDVWEVIEASATKPFGFMKFQPGPGLGGHCIPIDPLYLSWKMKTLNYSARFIELASEINTFMPRFTVDKIQDALNMRKKPLNGSNVLILGVAYKADIEDMRESPALDIIHLLDEKGSVVSYHDPYVPTIMHEGIILKSVDDLSLAVKNADCVAIITNHSNYDYKMILDEAKLIVDTRNALRTHGQQIEKVVRL
jgi:UDP-N-acetyl-D-glucosamine dehydrogenase